MLMLSHIFPFQDCQQVVTDGKRSVSGSNRTYGVYDGAIDPLNPPVSSEIKDGQWLGVEVASQGEGGKVIVCAHRYWSPWDERRSPRGNVSHVEIRIF